MTAALVLLLLAAGYLTGVRRIERRGGTWPATRTALWVLGLTAVAVGLAGAGHDFVAHMRGHLFLAMAAPLLLTLAAPVTLALRALPVGYARRLSRLLKSAPMRFVAHPVPAALLNAGGLWLLYTTGLHQRIAHDVWLGALLHVHLLAAGYLFTAAIVGVDPAPHRAGRPLRAAVLVAFLAAHGILAKYLYGHPPPGVPAAEAEAGAQLMYYGGDLIDAVLIAVFCYQWYRATGQAGACLTTWTANGSRPAAARR